MGTKRQLAAAASAMLALAGCSWGFSKPDDCGRFAVGAGNARLEQLASASGLSRATIEHSLCSDQRDRLEGLAGVRHEEVGWCAHVEELVPASASAAGASVRRWCGVAVQRRVRYAHWSSVLGGRFLFVGEREMLESSQSPGGSVTRARTR
jgi:hypothetical protein